MQYEPIRMLIAKIFCKLKKDITFPYTPLTNDRLDKFCTDVRANSVNIPWARNDVHLHTSSVHYDGQNHNLQAIVHYDGQKSFDGIYWIFGISMIDSGYFACLCLQLAHLVK